MNYGLPYKGSKNMILPWLCGCLPPGNTFVDLFCGGGSVTHYMMSHHRYQNYTANDVNPMMPSALLKALNGGFVDERRWISRNDFFQLKDTDPYVSLCFSFGCDQRSYIYAGDLEPVKRAAHYAVVFDDWQQLRELLPPGLFDGAYYAVQKNTPPPFG